MLASLGGSLGNLKSAHPHPLAYKMSWTTVGILGLLIVLVYVLFKLSSVGASDSKTVLVTINGLADTYTTHSYTVAGLLAELKLEDTISQVTPNPSKPLTNQMQIVIATEPIVRNAAVAANMQSAIKKAQEELKKQEEALKIPKSPIYTGIASWYTFGNGMNTASRQFPRGTTLRVVAIKSSKYIDVVVNDYGPEDWTGVDLDLNKPAFAKLAPLGAGIISIRYYKI